MSTSIGPTAEDLRAEIARRRVVVYRLASLIAIHPSRLSLYLNGHLPLPPDLGSRILEAIQGSDLTKPR